ncbi:hypothetical protein [Flavobacterium sp. UBA7680]|uniref:hypothetical protein n=1 Tax=Flavobacterium sp. UBA7680 TaxID=1946559 RepID=UPI0025B8FD1C|nr:hypothetical protein [Flavobacterium sp. UBA7680]
MKKILLILSVIVIVSCKTENKEAQYEETNTVENTGNCKSGNALKKFSTLKEMLADSRDFNEDGGTLKFISLDEKKLHVQISKPVLENDLERVKNEIVKRDIIYVAYQTFAQTTINELTITSVPNSNDNPKKYFEKYKQTVKINRGKAKEILKKYLDSEDFSILYEEQNGMWLPSKNFSVLKFEKLDEVFDEINNK